MSDTFIPVEAIGRNTRGFDAMATGSPCDGCSAPCCRIVLTRHPTPTTFSDLDYVRYVLGFPGFEMIVQRDGSWQQLVHSPCSLLDGEHARCTVHGTPRKPKVCVYFDPYTCWYKRNFTTADPPDLVRLDLPRFELLLRVCEFDDSGRLVTVPSWEQLKALVPPPLVPGTDPPVTARAG